MGAAPEPRPDTLRGDPFVASIDEPATSAIDPAAKP